jgi:hypothetical protein
MGFPGGEGQTDKYSTRLISEGTKRGFTVVALDAFYKTKIKPRDKRKFRMLSRTRSTFIKPKWRD